MSYRTCSIPGCDGKHLARDFCAKHYHRWKKFGDPNADHTRKRGTCKVDDCTSETEGHGYCNMHYQRWKKHGDASVVLSNKRLSVCSIADCGREAIARDLCAGHYTRARAGRPIDATPLRRYIITDDVAGRMREYTPVASTNACWEWTGARRKGYGVVSVQSSRNRDAHIVAWELANGRPVPSGMVIRHSCDNPPCVNPAHLLLGTHRDNVRDKVERDRQSKGVDHGLSKLSAADVQAIRQLAARGVRQRRIADDFGISQSNVSLIANRKGWQHVT